MDEPRPEDRDPEPPRESRSGPRWLGIGFFLLMALWFFTSFFKDVF